jgi:lysophospholipase L1-like esterase
MGCGGGSPAGPSGGATHTVSAIAYYDENGNGLPDVGEDARLGGVTVSIGGRTARSETPTGRATVNDVPAGQQTGELRGLLPFFRPGAPVSVAVPANGDVMLGATLPIGTNQPHVYMAFGDSITVGDGSRNSQGYVVPLERALRGFFGQATIVNQGQSGTRSPAGAARIGGNLRRTEPAYTLILYGTNDWNECGNTVPCYTIDMLRRIVDKTWQLDSLPVLATLPPVHPDYPGASVRNNWVSKINDLIVDLAAEQQALLVDLESAFLAEPRLKDLFSDHVHPNDEGYAIIADTFFAAITQPAAGAAAFEPLGFAGFDDAQAAPDLEALPQPTRAPAPRPRSPLAKELFER